MFKKNKRVFGAKKALKSGFTLIELLVVISIIALLATIITINVTSARQKSRNAKRKADIVSLQAPLEAYYDVNNQYPITAQGTWWGTCADYGGKDVTGSNGWVPNLAPTYVKRLPSDPLDTNPYCYRYRSDDGSNFKIIAVPPPSESPVFNVKDPLYDTQRSNAAWMVCSGEPACTGW